MSFTTMAMPYGVLRVRALCFPSHLPRICKVQCDKALKKMRGLCGVRLFMRGNKKRLPGFLRTGQS